MMKQGNEGYNPYNHNPHESNNVSPLEIEAESIPFDMTEEEALEAQKQVYKTLDYLGKDKGELNTNMASMRGTDEKKAA